MGSGRKSATLKKHSRWLCAVTPPTQKISTIKRKQSFFIETLKHFLGFEGLTNFLVLFLVDFWKFISLRWICTEWFMRGTFWAPTGWVKCGKSTWLVLLGPVREYFASDKASFQLEWAKICRPHESKCTAQDVRMYICRGKSSSTLMGPTLEPHSLTSFWSTSTIR